MTDREIEIFIDLPGTVPGEPSGRTERVGQLWTRTREQIIRTLVSPHALPSAFG